MDDEKAAALTKASLRSPIVTIVVGTDHEKKTFYVHEHLLTSASQYFKTALESKFTEAQSKDFRLDEDDADAFELFVGYLYKVSETGKDCKTSLRDYAEGFALGDKLMASSFKKQILLWVAQRLLDNRKRPRQLSMRSMIRAAGIVYNRVPEKSGLEMRRLLGGYCASRLGARSNRTSLWNSSDRLMLAKSRHYSFVADVMGQVSPLSPSKINSERSTIE